MNKEYLVYNNGNEFMSLPANSENEKGFKDFIKEEKRKGSKTFKVTIWNPKEKTKVACDYDINSKKFKNISNGFTASQPTVIKKGHTNKIKNGKNEPRVLLQNKGLLGFDNFDNVEELLSVIVERSFNENLYFLNKLINILKINKKIIDHKDLYEKVYGFSPTIFLPDEKFYKVLAENKKELFCFLRKCCELFPDDIKGFLLTARVKYKK